MFSRKKTKRSLVERLVRKIFYKYYARNLFFELQIRARNSSADYVEKNMPDAIVFWNLQEILEYCLEQAPAEGMILEFGVGGGKSTKILAATVPGRTVHGFDSFEGLPEDWGGHVEMTGSFSREGEMPEVAPNVTLHKGWFKDTIIPFKQDNPEKIAFLHIDCDIYSSTREVLWSLADRLSVGTIIEFDEYFNYPNWQRHEFRAWQEFVKEFNIKYRYLAMTAADGRAAVKILEIPD